jgi:hypothetical protein
MSEANGVIRIGRKGKMKFAFGDGPAFEVDIIEIHDEWWVIDQSLRDAENKVPVDQTCAYNMSKLTYVQNIVNKACGPGAPILTHAEAAEFIVKVQQEVLKLRDFFDPALSEQPISPLPTELRFSQ